MMKWTAVLAALLAATPAQAELVTASDPQLFKAILESRGWEATIVTPDGAAPYIQIDNGDLKFRMFFLNCVQNKQCQSVQYFLAFSDAKSMSLESLNEWNRTKRYARAYRDREGDPVLEMDVNLGASGIPRPNVGLSLNIWANLMEDYRKFVIDRTRPKAPAESSVP